MAEMGHPQKGGSVWAVALDVDARREWTLDGEIPMLSPPCPYSPVGHGRGAKIRPNLATGWR